MNSQETQFVVTLDHFEGPLDLLHQLIEKRKLQINTISLSKVTADYLKHIQQTNTVSAEEIAQFIYVASILILIKSRSLLPLLEYTKEEEQDTEALEQRVQLYDAIQKKVVPALATWKKVAHIVKPPKVEQVIEFTPDDLCTAAELRKNAQSVLQGLSFLKEPPRKNVSRTIHIGDVIDKILAMISERVSMKLNDLKCSDKQEQVVSFLAVLELIRREFLDATQTTAFGDIVIIKKEKTI